MVPVVNHRSQCRRAGLSWGTDLSQSNPSTPLPNWSHFDFSGGSSPSEGQCDCPQPCHPKRTRVREQIPQPEEKQEGSRRNGPQYSTSPSDRRR